jgi:hypothetical protein
MKLKRGTTPDKLHPSVRRWLTRQAAGGLETVGSATEATLHVRFEASARDRAATRLPACGAAVVSIGDTLAVVRASVAAVNALSTEPWVIEIRPPEEFTPSGDDNSE